MENYNIKVGDKCKSLNSASNGRQKDEIITIAEIKNNNVKYFCKKSPKGINSDKTIEEFLKFVTPYLKNVELYEIY